MDQKQLLMEIEKARNEGMLARFSNTRLRRCPYNRNAGSSAKRRSWRSGWLQMDRWLRNDAYNSARGTAARKNIEACIKKTG